MDLQSFMPIAETFKAVFLDSYGVLKNYNGLIEGAGDTIRALREKALLSGYLLMTHHEARSNKLKTLQRLD
jgi:ribonucleotide monophosphatase NagD (HAD superfamily)